MRVPVVRAHSVAVNAEFERPVSVEAARAGEAGQGFATSQTRKSRNPSAAAGQEKGTKAMVSA